MLPMRMHFSTALSRAIARWTTRKRLRHACIRLGFVDRGALRPASPQNEVKSGGDPRPLRSTPFLRAPARLSQCDDRGQHGFGARHCGKVPLEGLPDPRRCGRSAALCSGAGVRWPTSTSMARPSIYHRSGPIYEDYVRSFALAARLKFQAGDFFRRPATAGRRLNHGAHPARLESGAKRHPLLQKA